MPPKISPSAQAPTATVENYLKRLYTEQQSTPRRLVPMGRLASVMGVVPGTATSMVKALAEAGLVSYRPRSGAKLTSAGEQVALNVLRRHRLIELFLVNVLGLHWSEVHKEAEQLEHAISDKVLDRIDGLLNHPRVDPHGDPIPTAGGEVAEPRLVSLADAAVGRRVRIARIIDQTPAFLQFLDRSGLRPGTAVLLLQSDSAADALSIRAGNLPPVALGMAAARKVLVEEA